MNTALGNIIAKVLFITDSVLEQFVTSIVQTSANLALGTCQGSVNVQLNACGDTLVENLAVAVSALAALGGEIFAALGALSPAVAG
jgi:UDP-N-acetylmuramyl pentapeptide synthase